MSSHHVVREKQEPALLVLGMDNFPDEFLGQLLEWSPTVIVTPDTAEKLNAYGIKIDLIISDEHIGDMQSDIKQISKGNDTPAEAALKYLVAKGYPAVNIITDDPDLNSYMFFVDQINMVIFNSNKKVYAVSSGFSKWKAAGETIEILSASSQVDLTGLEASGDHRYRTTNDGFFTLRFDQPFLFIAEEL